MAMTRYWLIPAVVLQVVLIAAVGCTQESAETKATHHRERAIAYFDKGEYREAILEFKNVFNNRQTSAIPRIITTDAAGVPLAPIPAEGDAFPVAGRSGYESRQFQIGFKFYY